MSLHLWRLASNAVAAPWLALSARAMVLVIIAKAGGLQGAGAKARKIHTMSGQLWRLASNATSAAQLTLHVEPPGQL